MLLLKIIWRQKNHHEFTDIEKSCGEIAGGKHPVFEQRKIQDGVWEILFMNEKGNQKSGSQNKESGK